MQMAVNNTSVDYGPTQSVGILAFTVPTGHILCHCRWLKTDLIAAMKGRGIRVAFDESLGFVDFCPSNNMAVVYITEADLVSGVAFRRRIAKLRKAENVQGIVVAEKTQLSSQYFTSFQKFVVLELGLVLIPVCHSDEAAGFLAKLLDVDMCPYKNDLRLRPKQPPVENRLLLTLQTIPKLGETKAAALVERFHSIYDLCQASQEVGDFGFELLWFS